MIIFQRIYIAGRWGREEMEEGQELIGEWTLLPFVHSQSECASSFLLITSS
jgi:hypothetical protein